MRESSIYVLICINAPVSEQTRFSSSQKPEIKSQEVQILTRAVICATSRRLSQPFVQHCVFSR